MFWVKPVSTSKHLCCPHSPLQREFCTEGLLGRHALGMLGRTLNWKLHVYERSTASLLYTIEHNDTDHHNETEHHNETSGLCSSCDTIYDFVQELLINLNVTTPCCLGNTSACDEIGDATEPPATRTDPAKGIIYKIKPIFAESFYDCHMYNISIFIYNNIPFLEHELP